MMPHPTDPAAPFRAADVFGRLLAAGQLSEAEARTPLAAAALAARDPAGCRARLAWRLTAAAASWRRRRSIAVRAVRAALRPLLAARAPKQVLLAAAAHADPDCVLGRVEREVIVRGEVLRALGG